jgi:uncharacterized protein (DUF169 family)
MEIDFKNKFLSLYQKYFNDSPLPIVFYYSDGEMNVELSKPKSYNCLIGALSEVRDGKSLRFDRQAITCGGGNRFLGFSQELRPNFEQFLSGVERYKKSPELVREMMKSSSGFVAPKNFIVFKRWDRLEELDQPEVVIFFATPDVVSGLFTLANYDEETNAVATPTGSGCSSIILNPYLETQAQHPRCVLGMFDVSARPFVPKDQLTFAVPFTKFVSMVDNMESSFLTTKTWKKVQERIKP